MFKSKDSLKRIPNILMQMTSMSFYTTKKIVSLKHNLRKAKKTLDMRSQNLSESLASGVSALALVLNKFKN